MRYTDEEFNMEQSRESNFDLLRIICSVAVITIHVSATYKTAITNEETFGTIYTSHIFVTLLYNTLSRFAVPCFVMLSGAFILSNDKNSDYYYFYHKCFRSIGITTIIFSVLYFLYSIAISIVIIKVRNEDWTVLLTPVKDLIKGKPYYHMWYLYAMIGVYILVPILHRLKKDMKEKTFDRIAWVFLVLACLSMWTSTRKLNWDIGGSFCYLGYFMVGYVMRKWAANHKNNLKGICLIVMGFLVELGITYLQYSYSLQGFSETDINYGLIDPQAPLIVVSSVLIFGGFSMLRINRNFGKLSGFTFLIYLFHAGVWDLLGLVVKKVIGVRGDNRIIIPASILIVFCFSYLLSIVYKNTVEKTFLKVLNEPRHYKAA